MVGGELHNFNIKFTQLWNAGYEVRLTEECRADKAIINLQVTLSNHPQPSPTCQVQPQSRRTGPSRLQCREQHDEARTAAANATDNTKTCTSAVNSLTLLKLKLKQEAT